MIERHLSCLAPSGFHRIVYSEWPGPKGAPTLLCVHGLTRNGRDFDAVAERLSAHYRVICPDMPGRGRSERLANPAEYVYPTYVQDCAALIARLDVETLDWIGTSMGGLIGMMIAARPGNPIRRLVVNDIGPFVSKEGLERIGSYVGLDPNFASFAEFEAMLRKLAAPFGSLTDAQWRKMATDMAEKKPGGGWGFAYDPAIANAFKAGPIVDIDLWPIWEAIRAPTLVLRGADSDLLSRATAEDMTRRGPKAKLAEFAGIGHAPALLSEDQIGAIEDFLVT
ncbi:MAG TPA: alpha/beta hydrolase [Roseiarcus sp.]|jgi:pimeloyl-ACP methyl ester carboxylesterase